MLNFLSQLFSNKPAEFEIPFSKTPGGKIIAVKVLQVEKHPNADRLRVVYVTDGQKELGPIVCGAFNFEAGDMVVLALPGAHIAQNIHSDAHESFTLTTAKIRGVESQGMICSSFELGLTQKPEEKPEILVLPGAVKPGTTLA